MKFPGLKELSQIREANLLNRRERAIKEIKELSMRNGNIPIISFGSFARNELNFASDADFLIDAKHPIDTIDTEIKLTDILSKYSFKADIRWIGYAGEELVKRSSKDWVVYLGGKVYDKDGYRFFNN